MECFVCGGDKSEINDEACKLFTVGKSKFIVCQRCLSHANPEADFADVISCIKTFQSLKKKVGHDM